MKIGLIGLGRMGAGIAERLRRNGHDVVGYDQNPAISQVKSVEELVRSLPQPRVVWVMVPAGGATQATVDELAEKMAVGDIIIDGGNSYYKDSMRRGVALKQKGISFVDVGTSGGIWGLTGGFSLMAGGEKPAYDRIEPLLKALAPTPETGYGYMGPSGAGHFVKMVHNGVEYGMMQAYAEGFELMQAKNEFNLDLHNIAEVWRFGSVVRSWLLDLAANALEEDPKPREARSVRGRLRRGSLDRPGGDRSGRARARDLRLAVRPFPFAPVRSPSAPGCLPPCATSSAATP